MKWQGVGRGWKMVGSGTKEGADGKEITWNSLTSARHAHSFITAQFRNQLKTFLFIRPACEPALS